MWSKSWWVLALWVCVLCFSARAGEIARNARANQRLEHITLGGKTYKARWIGGEYGESNRFVRLREDLAYIFDGKNVFVVDPLHARLIKTLALPFPMLALSPDERLALVEVDATREKKSGELRSVTVQKSAPALMEVATQKIIARFDELKSANWRGGWVFSADGQFIFPLSSPHGAAEYSYLDVANKAVIKAPLHSKQFVADPLSGVVSQDGKQLLAFSRAVDRDNWRPTGSKLIRVALSDPAKLDVAKATTSVITLATEREGKILAWQRQTLLSDERPPAILSDKYSLAWVDARSLKILVRSPQNDFANLFAMQISPDGKDIYALDAYNGLSIYDVSTLEPRTHLKIGRIANSYSIGATFSSDGQFAFIAEPYGKSFYVIDVASQKVIETNTQLGQGIAGVLPIGDGCFVFATLLPYE